MMLCSHISRCHMVKHVSDSLAEYKPRDYLDT